MDYSKTIIYKIICREPTILDCYVGHTTNFVKRKYHHQSDCNTITQKNYNNFIYRFIRENGGWKNWNMILIEEVECKNFNEACKKEQYWIDELKPLLNTRRAFNSDEDWKEYFKKYRETEKHITYMETYREKANERSKEYYQNNKEEKLKYASEYKQINYEEILINQKNNWEKNKDKYNQKTTCICGSIFLLRAKNRHNQTTKHQNFIKNNLIIDNGESV